MDRVDYESAVIQDLLNYYNREELDIAPWYQRRAVWNSPQKAYLINTIHEHKPVPSIFIRHTIDVEKEKNVKEVVDGQQRIRCIIEYRADAFAARHPGHEKPVKYSGLTKAQKSRFLLTALSVGYLINADEGDVVEIFARINSVAKTLNPQEKRNALYSGEYKQFCVKEAVERIAFWRNYGIFSDTEISRMIEVQFVSDLVMNLREGLQDFSASRLSKYYAQYDIAFPEAAKAKSRLEKVFEILLEQKPDVLKGSVFCVPQILLSLLLVLDALGKVPRQKLEAVITDFDARYRAIRDGENTQAMPPDLYEAFSSGNLHRIKARKRRATALKVALKP